MVLIITLMEINKIATNLTHQNGIWFSGKRGDIAYPAEGNRRCFAIENDSFWFQHRNKCILMAMKYFPPGGAVFDVGAGNGYVSLGIKNAGFNVVAIEPGIRGALNARTRGLDYVICSRLEDAGFKPEIFPSAGLFDVLEHIEDDAGFLCKIKKMLIPGGRLYITVPAYNFLWSFEDKRAGHFRRYTIKSLVNLFEYTGYKVEYMSYTFSILPLPIYFFRVLPGYIRKKRNKYHSNCKLKEHGIKYNFSRRLLDLILKKESRILMNKKTIPFGGSCLIVAKSSAC